MVDARVCTFRFAPQTTKINSKTAGEERFVRAALPSNLTLARGARSLNMNVLHRMLYS
jgi:hypothetical protein